MKTGPHVALGSSALLCSAVLSACGGGTGSAACIDAVTWNGDQYFRFPVDKRRAPATAERLGVAEKVPCSDEQPASQPPERRVEIVRLRGVSPQVAVGRAGDVHGAYLAAGYLPELRTHPLHHATRLGALRVSRCEQRISVRARVVRSRTAIQSVTAQVGVRAERLAFPAASRVRGFLRAGEPYLRRGDLVSIDGRRCDAAGPGMDARVLVVDELRPAR